MMGGGGDGGPSGEGGPCAKCNNKNNPRDQDNQRERNDQAQAPAPGAPATDTLDLGGTLGGGTGPFESFSGDPINPSVPIPVVVAPTTTPPDNSDQPRARELSNINNEKRKALLERKGTDLTGAAAKEKDIQTLYDALAVLLSDKRCDFARVETKQTFQSREGVITPSEPIKIDPSSTGIGGGDITFYSDDKKVTPVTLSWDANHFTEMSLKDWLYGHPTGPTNGHIGFYRQLVLKNLCGLTNAEHPDPLRVKPNASH